MKQLSDKSLLRQIVMPGSHDAGVYGTVQTIVRAKAFVKPEYTVCQHSDFSRQALEGSRFFDCRVFLREIPKIERKECIVFENTKTDWLTSTISPPVEPFPVQWICSRFT